MPVWNITLRLADLIGQWKDGDLTIPELAEKVVERIKSSGWRDITPYPHTFDEVVTNLLSAEDRGEYENLFEEIYDLADQDRVWIETS